MSSRRTNTRAISKSGRNRCGLKGVAIVASAGKNCQMGRKSGPPPTGGERCKPHGTGRRAPESKCTLSCKPLLLLRSPLAILSETLGMTQFGDGWPQRSQLQPGAPSLGRCVTLLPVTFCSLCLGDPLSSCNKRIVFIVSAQPFRVSVEQFHEARFVKITHRGLAIWLDPFGMSKAQVVVNLLAKFGIGADLVRHGYVKHSRMPCGSEEKPQDSSNPAAFCRAIPSRTSIDNDAINDT